MDLNVVGTDSNILEHRLPKLLMDLSVTIIELIVLKVDVIGTDSNILECQLSNVAIELSMNKFE